MIYMKELNVFAYGDAGVKGFEILFQKNIEDCAAANGFPDECWWNVVGHEEQIFMKLFNIYQNSHKDGGSIIIDIQDYYDYLREKTHKIIKERLG